ncbi:hypothetical protein [Prescottella equi]|uniref:hypothetical protein n=1 Tax=Rhodococcus hoagii TaxID=43767 RepID=UPI001585BBF3|nr:hypothetical protein [Prescottella equi]
MKRTPHEAIDRPVEHPLETGIVTVTQSGHRITYRHCCGKKGPMVRREYGTESLMH